eukprot:6200745-Pleurochrysis_carterae.AAC.1
MCHEFHCRVWAILLWLYYSIEAHLAISLRAKGYHGTTRDYFLLPLSAGTYIILILVTRVWTIHRVSGAAREPSSEKRSCCFCEGQQAALALDLSFDTSIYLLNTNK